MRLNHFICILKLFKSNLLCKFSVAVDLVSQKISYFDDRSATQKDNRRSLLDEYLLNPKLDLSDVVGMASDLLLTGVDTVIFIDFSIVKIELLFRFTHFFFVFIFIFSFFTFNTIFFFRFLFVPFNMRQTTYSTCFLLYHIARHPDVQEKLFQEAINVLPTYDTHELTADKLDKQLSYSKAVLKESFRLNPVSVGVGRITNTDLILSGYNLPKGVIY